MRRIEKVIGKQKYRLDTEGEHDNLTKTVAKKTAESIRKKGGQCRIIKKSNGQYQIWVSAPYTITEIKKKNVAGGHYFFSKLSLAAFPKDTYHVKYNPSTGITFLMVTHPNQRYDPSVKRIVIGRGIRQPESLYKFSPKTGALSYISNKD